MRRLEERPPPSASDIGRITYGFTNYKDHDPFIAIMEFECLVEVPRDDNFLVILMGLKRCHNFHKWHVPVFSSGIANYIFDWTRKMRVRIAVISFGMCCSVGVKCMTLLCNEDTTRMSHTAAPNHEMRKTVNEQKMMCGSRSSR